MSGARQEFAEAQRGMLDRYGVDAESRFVDVPSIEGRAHALVSGEGPPVVMINGAGTPGAMWAPLMAELDEVRLFAVDLLVATERLPGYRRTFLSTLHTLLRLRGGRPATRMTAGQLARIDHPTLQVWGEEDPFGSPEVGERMVEIMPDSELQVVGGGHAPWLTQSERIGARVTRFLRRHG